MGEKPYHQEHAPCRIGGRCIPILCSLLFLQLNLLFFFMAVCCPTSGLMQKKGTFWNGGRFATCKFHHQLSQEGRSKNARIWEGCTFELELANMCIYKDSCAYIKINIKRYITNLKPQTKAFWGSNNIHLNICILCQLICISTSALLTALW